ncbi:hypothetical protein LZQ00_00715 [Sphingobacterium sp. SRCM116780]|uniref:hypothetical protein n=1 Tax=Sphingobacterium sp. SRCM116780 TaxID=2907623 RepID=UPI001F21DE76|nr:hypothetical protein [Sphingobacterium sp. SRCM116780]UIR56364.1 hypothetical protein LZQ00_00715 [Sphingobacterium sp. SRCM116780]
MSNDNSYFFVAKGELISQRKEQAFGVVDENRFQVTASFDVSSPSMAYAICKGVVFILPQQGAESDTVNLILKPYTQPIAGVKIKYFVYRGLQRSEFFTQDSTPLVIEGPDTSDFIQTIQKSFTSLYKQGETPEFKAEYIGYNAGFQMDTLLSSVFFKTSSLVSDAGITTENDAYELPMIDMGKSLGQFKSGECGIDVVLDYGDFENPQDESLFRLDIAYASAKKVEINIATISDAYQKKLKKEQIFQFLDIAAFYGYHANGGTVDTVLGKLNGANIYNNLLQNLSTKNNVYLYIQSDRGRSYNFYNNYNVGESTVFSLLKGSTDTALVESNYAENGWPILIDSQIQNHDANENKLVLQFPIDYNKNVAFYAQAGNLLSSTKEGFISLEDLSIPVAVNEILPSYCKPITLLHTNIGNNGAKSPIATFDLVLYRGKTYTYQVEDDLAFGNATIGNVNDIFDQINAASVFKSSEETHNSLLAIQKLKLMSPYYDKEQRGIWAVQTVITRDTSRYMGDLHRVTYVAEAVDALYSAVGSERTLPDTRTSSSSLLPSNSGDFFHADSGSYFDFSYFSDNQLNIPGISLVSIDGKGVNRIQIGLTKTENDRLIAAMGIAALHNVQLILLDLHGAGNQFLSIENVQYKKFRLALSGETADGQLKLQSIDEDIVVYTIDQYCYFSFQYASSIQDLFKDVQSNNSFVTFNMN